MYKRLAKETIEEKVQTLSCELSKLQSGHHILTGQTFKAWRVVDQRHELMAKELQERMEEYQKLLRT